MYARFSETTKHFEAGLGVCKSDQVKQRDLETTTEASRGIGLGIRHRSWGTKEPLDSNSTKRTQSSLPSPKTD
jgi:hypothetical protein